MSLVLPRAFIHSFDVAGLFLLASILRISSIFSHDGNSGTGWIIGKLRSKVLFVPIIPTKKRNNSQIVMQPIESEKNIETHPKGNSRDFKRTRICFLLPCGYYRSV